MPRPDSTIPKANGRDLPRPRPRRSAALGGDPGQLQVQAASGQRLLIPCRYSSRPSASRAVGSEAAWRRGPIVAPSRDSRPVGAGVALIVWHKDDQLNSPVFVADTRGSGSIREAKQRAISESLKGRARVDSIEVGSASKSSSIVLIIEEARLEDAGVYTCMIEFDWAPTQMHQTSVVILDPPKNMIIRDESPSSPQNRFPISLNPAGPYDEGAHLVLACEAQRGQPEAGQISWWRLESVNQIGPEMLRATAAASRSSAVQQNSAESANYLTTLSISNDRDLYLGRDSFQQYQVPLQQLAGQLLAPSNLTNLLLANGNSSLSGVRLRHWRRVDNSSSSIKPTGGTASQQLESNGATILSRLEIQRLSRANLADEFLCLALNNLNVSPPLNASLALDMNLRPTEVRLVTKSTEAPNFRPGRKTMIECHAMGSKPSPEIRWFLGSRQIVFDRQQATMGEHSPDGANLARMSEFSRDLNNLTKVSYLTLTPEIEDNQLQLSCSAHNPKLERDDSSAPAESQIVVSDPLKINVQFAPKLSLQLGAVIRPDAIRLGSDIFMDCLIEANPNDIQELVWLHDGQPLLANISAGIVITNNQSLVLRNIGVHQRGAYECRARNSLGQSTSNRLELRPRHEPICDEVRTKRRYEIALNQPTRIECHMLAEPSEDLRFTWRFNRSDGASSGESAQVVDDSLDHDLLASGDSLESAVIRQHETNFTQSSVLFTATSRRHFGQLLCSASNDLSSSDKQTRPCSIQLVQSEVPEPVRGCFVEVHSASSFSIHCQSSSSKSSAVGLAGTTRYILELYQIEQPTRGSGSSNERTSSALDSNLMKLRQPGDAQPPGGDYEDDEQSDRMEMAELQGLQNQRQNRVRRLDSELPSFDVADLSPNATYNIVIYVQNQKGRSQATHHQVSLGQTHSDGSPPKSMRSSDTADQPHSGRPEQVGKRSSWPAAPSTSSQLLSFLRIDDLLGGRSQSQSSALPPPLVAVALIVLLSTISLVMLVFFVNKLICSNHRPSPTSTTSIGSSNSKRRKSSTRGGGNSSSPTQDDVDDEEDQPSDDQFVKRRRESYARERHINKATAMTDRSTKLRVPDRCQGVQIGSGSDTSRETNTDSTLISSPASKMTNSKQTDSTLNSGEHTSSDWIVASNQMAAANRHKRCSHGDLTQLSAAHLIDSQRQCSGQHHDKYNSSTLTTHQRLDKGRLNMTARPASGLDDQAMLNLMNAQQQQVSLYGTSGAASAMRRERIKSALNNHLDQSMSRRPRALPQVSSVQGSECSSNNIDNSLDLAPLSDCHNSPNLSQSDQFQSQLMHYNYLLTPGQPQQAADLQQSDHFDMGQLAGIADSGVYVISDGSSEHPRLDYGSENTPTGVTNPQGVGGEFWCPQRTPSRGQMSSACDLKRCHLIGDATNSLQRDTNTHSFMLTNSFSIPISLVNSVQDDRLSSACRMRHLSTENLTLGHHDGAGQEGAHCWSAADPTSSINPEHITLAEAEFPGRNQQQHHLMPPADFANDYQCYQKTISVPCSSRLNSNEAHSTLPLAQKPPKPFTSHRVKFDTSNIN